MDNINDLLSSLTDEDFENLKSIAQSIFNNNETKNQASNNNDGINPEMIFKITQIMNALNSDGGKRYNLIEALKPNLSPKRQKKADEAMKFIKLLDILPLIQNLKD